MTRTRTGTATATLVALIALMIACDGSVDPEGERSDTPPASASPDKSDTELEETAGPEAPQLWAGELIAFERVQSEDERALYAVGPEGGEPTFIRSQGDYPHWSPDGSQLAFLACLNPPDCTTATALFDRSTGDVRGFLMPDPDLYTPCVEWTPSARRLACEGTSESDPTRNGVYAIRASDGRGRRRITSNPGGIDHPLAYSPDGRQLLFSREDPSRGGLPNQALFVTPISGGQPRRITPWGYTDDWASWSPDGRTIVFGTNGYLYRVSPEGQGLAKINPEMPDGPTAPNFFDVSFSPDGQRIVFSFGIPTPGIYTARPDGSDVQQITTSPTEDHHASWGPARS